MCSSTGKVTGNNVTGRKVKYRRVILKGMCGRGHFQTLIISFRRMVMHKDKIKKSKSKIYLSDPNPGFTVGVYCGSVF